MNGFEVVDSWLTPTVLFCILNLTIVTIFILKPHEKLKELTQAQHLAQLVRVRPFLFERVQSINLSMYRPESQPDPDHLQETYLPPLVPRVKSLLELVKPVKFSLFGSKTQSDPVQQETYREEPAHVTRSRSDTVRKEMKNQLITSYYENQSKYEKPVPVKKAIKKSVSETSPVVETCLPQLVRVQSLLLERVEPIKISLFGSKSQSDPVQQKTYPAAHEEPVHEHDAEERNDLTRSRSDMVRKEMKPVKKVLRKSVSVKSPVEAEEVVEQRRPATVREKTTTSHGDEAVDAKADDFINRFRKQLKLQRRDADAHFEIQGNVEQRDWEVSGGIELLG